MEIRPSAFGKGATFFQALSVVAVLADLANVATLTTLWLTVLFVVAGTVTAAAGLQYMYRGIVWVSREQLGSPPPGAPPPLR
jgi:phosphatidylglycerophosphate synthase